MDTEDRLHEIAQAVYDNTTALARIGDLLEYHVLETRKVGVGSVEAARAAELRDQFWPLINPETKVS